MNDRQKTLLVCLGLIVGIAVVFGPLVGCDFAFFDDQVYIHDNSQVTRGLSWSGFFWAFRSGYASNWHPLTWLSHMLDCQIYGLNPAGAHLTNILFHTANVLLLFFLLKKMTRLIWPCAIVTALFAFHPLRLESVAWIAERKDVLCLFFSLLSLHAYVRHAMSPTQKTWWRNPAYWFACLFFVLALMSKPMAVTLPAIMLLLDFWPLQRMHKARAGKLLMEKIPLFLLTAILSWITLAVQKKGGGVTESGEISWSVRLAHIALSYQEYIKKILWPAQTSIIYVWRQPSIPAGLLAMAVLAGISIVLLFALRRRPWLAVGWFWFLGALLPVIGVVHIGAHFIAERYTYFPSVGFFCLIVFGLYYGLDLGVVSMRSRLFGTMGVIAIGLYAGQTIRQTGNWRNGETLFTHAIEVDPNNYFAYNVLGNIYRLQKKMPEAQSNIERALVLNSDYDPAWNQKGNMLAAEGRVDEAADAFRHALRAHPAEPEYLFNLATMQKKQRHFAEARVNLQKALQGDPGYAAAHSALGTILDEENKPAEAAAEYRLALQGDPRDAVAHNNLAVYLLSINDPAGAAAHWVEAVKIDPANFQFHYNLSCALARIGQSAAAVEEYRRTLQLNPDWVPALQGLSWWLATHEQNSKEALPLAERACQLTANKDPLCLAALDAALAQQGRFPDAITAAEKTLAAAQTLGNDALVKNTRQRIELYRSGKPYLLSN